MPINQTGNAFVGATIPTNVGNLLKLMIATARETPQADGNLTQLFQNDPLPTGMGTSWNSTKLGTLTAYSLVQGIDMQQQQALIGTNVSITPGEVGVQVVLTRKSVNQWSEDVAMRAGEQMRRAMDRKKDADIGGLFSGFARRAGAAGAVFSLGHVGAAVSRLAGGANTTGTAITAGTGTDVQDGPFITIVRPESVHHLLRSMIGAAYASAPTVGTTSPGLTGGRGDDLSRTGQGGMSSVIKPIADVAGTTLYRNPNLAKDSSDDVAGYVGEKGGIVYVPMDYEGLGSMNREPDESLRAFEINYVEDYGFGELDDNKGIELLLDATPATS